MIGLVAEPHISDFLVILIHINLHINDLFPV